MEVFALLSPVLTQKGFAQLTQVFFETAACTNKLLGIRDGISTTQSAQLLAQYHDVMVVPQQVLKLFYLVDRGCGML